MAEGYDGLLELCKGLGEAGDGVVVALDGRQADLTTLGLG